MTSFAYDSRGRMSSIDADDGLTFSYDDWDRLTSIRKENEQGRPRPNKNYTYDYRSRMLSAYDLDTMVQEVYSYSDGVAVIRRVHGGIYCMYRGPDQGGGVAGLNYAEKSDGTGLNYKFYNLRGDVVVTRDSSGSIKTRSEYDAFGEHRDTGEITTDKYRANTKYEGDFGLLNEGKRWRSLKYGVFLTPDPLEYVDGFNPYIYCGQNPWGRWDPLGLASFQSEMYRNPELVKESIAGVAANFAPVNKAMAVAMNSTVKNPKFMGGVQMLGGAFEMVAGGAIAGGGTVVSGGSATIQSVVAGGAIILHGSDNFYHGAMQISAGEWQTTTTAQTLQSMGMSEDTANFVDAGIGITGGVVAGVKGSIGTARILASEDAKGMTKMQALSRYEKGSMALDNDTYKALGGSDTRPIQKALEMEKSGMNPPVKPMKATSLIGTGLTPAAETVSGVATAGAQVTTHTARESIKKDEGR